MNDNRDNPNQNRAQYVHDSLKEHEFDGIQEFDNRLPNWWLWTLYGAIVFALVYWLVFHTLELRPLPREDFAVEMQQAAAEQLARAAAQGISNETFTMMAGIDNKVAEGRDVFMTHCVACHLDDARGLVGPNLTDGVWIHGCEPMQMYKTISDGVAAKGMPAWMNQLGPTRVQAVTAYILTIKDTNVAGKAPEGEPCTFDF